MIYLVDYFISKRAYEGDTVFLRIFLGFLLFPIIAGCESRTHSPDRIVLRNVSIIDGIGGDRLTGQNIAIANGRIEKIYQGNNRRRERGGKVLNLDGHTVLPGLINGHVHLGPNEDVVASLEAMIALGVTAVRNLGGPTAPLRDLNKTGDGVPHTLPDIFYAGTFAGPGFRDDPRIAPLIAANEGNDPEGFWFIDKTTDIAAAIADAKQNGVAGLKLYTGLDGDLVAEIVAEATRQDLPTWVHSVVFPANTDDAVNAKPTQLIHAKGLISAGARDVPDNFIDGVRNWVPMQDYDSAYLNEERYADLFSTIANAGIALEPALIADGDIAIDQGRTLAPWQTAMREWACEATRLAHRQEILITAGTDFFGKPGLLIREMKRLVECGLTPMEVITAATYNNAQVLGMQDSIGSIAPGMRADLLIVRGDPSGSIDVLEDVALVVKDGRIVYSDTNEAP